MSKYLKMFIATIFGCSLFYSSFINANEKNKEELLSFVETDTEEEALFLRRIADFWEEGEYELVKSEIENYLNQYTDSSFSNYLHPSSCWNYLHALLGNIYMQEGKHKEAVSYYNRISSQQIRSKIGLNLLQCLYEMQWHQTLTYEAQSILEIIDPETNDINKVYYFLAEGYYYQAKNEEENKDNFYTKAIENYEKLINTSFSIPSILALIECHFYFKNYAEITNYYFTLANKDPDQKEKHIFQAALTQSKYDKHEAINTLSLLTETNNIIQKDATFNKTMLLFELGNYEEIINNQKITLSSIPKEKQLYYHFLIGKSHFAMLHYEEAITALRQYISLEDKTDPNIKNALLSTMQCAIIKQDIGVLEECIDLYENHLQPDEQLAQAYFDKALLLKKEERFFEANKDFEKINKTFENFALNENFLFEYAHNLYELGDYSKAKDKFSNIVKNDSELTPTVWRYIVNCSIKITESSTSENLEKNKAMLAATLTSFLDNQNITTEEEKIEFGFLMAQTKFELKDYDEALVDFLDLIEMFPNHPNIANVHLFTAFCYKNQYLDKKNFCYHAEKALSLHPNIPQKGTILLSLFNTYLSLAKNKDKIDDNYLKLAGDYLYQAQLSNELNIKPENLLWLADLYYIQVKDYLNDDIQNSIEEDEKINSTAFKAIEIYEIAINKLAPTHQINENTLYLENPLIKLADLYGMTQNIDKKTQLLENLVKQYDNNYNWQHKDMACYNLGSMYENNNNFNKALEYFKKVSQTKQTSIVKPLAKLHDIRLRINSMQEEDKTLSNTFIVNALKELKSLSLQKNLESEPAHLEAALDYIDIQCDLETNQSQYEKRMFLLSRMLNNFTSQDDIISKDYHNSRPFLPSKDKIYNAYKTLMEAELFITKFNIAKKEKSTDAERYYQKAALLLNKLIVDKLLVTSYLFNRIEKNLSFLEENK